MTRLVGRNLSILVIRMVGVADRDRVTAPPQTSLRRLVLTALAVGLSVAAVIAIASIVTRSFDSTEARLIGTSLGFSLFSALGAAGASARRGSGAIRDLGTATVAMAGASFTLLLAAVWSDPVESDLWRAFGSLSLLTLAASHACLVLTARRAADPPLITALTVTSVGAASFDAVLGALAISGIAGRVDRDFARLLAAVVIVLLLTSVLPPILRRIPSRERPHPSGLPAGAPTAPASPNGQAADLLAIAGRLEQLAPSAGDVAGPITREAARLRYLAENPTR